MAAIRARFIVPSLLLIASAAWGHGEYDWIRTQGWKNPATGTPCCGLDDCAPLPAEAVRRAGSNWLITVGDRTHVYPVAEQLPSADGRYWLCLKWTGEPRCFFVPGLGA